VCDTDAHARFLFRFPDCSFARCSRCGFVYLDGERAIGMFGAVDCFGDAGYVPHLDIDRIAEEQVESLRAILARAGAPLESLPADAAVLDVGCARGHFLERLRRETGRSALSGIDLSPQMTEWGRDHFGLDLRTAHVEHADLEPGRFDLVTMWDVLEHLPFPRRTLERLLSLVRPGGWVVIEVPSEVTTFRMLATLAYRMSGGRLAGPARTLYHAAHLSYFTPGSLTALATRAGGRHVKIESKESHVTRFGLGRFPWPARAVILVLTGADRILGMQAKLLCAVRSPAAGD
jgi:SAM-dependent methyltransferase